METEPQRRGAKVVDAILDATKRELARVGFAGLSVEDVATHAGVNKTTIYRRWPTKLELVRAALTTGAAKVHHAAIDTGELRRDLLEYARNLRDGLSSPEGRSIYVALLANEPAIASLASELREGADAAVREILRRGIKRGELPRNADTELIGQMIFGALQYRVLFFHGEPVSDAYLAKAIELAIAGANATKSRR